MKTPLRYVNIEGSRDRLIRASRLRTETSRLCKSFCACAGFYKSSTIEFTVKKIDIKQFFEFSDKLPERGR